MKTEEKLVLVERFDELKLGVRVVVHCGICENKPSGILVDFLPEGSFRRGGRAPSDCWLPCPGHVCGDNTLPNVIAAETVAQKLVYRFAEDLGIDDQLAAEDDNPYTARSVVRTAGRDELVKVRR